MVIFLFKYSDFSELISILSDISEFVNRFLHFFSDFSERFTMSINVHFFRRSAGPDQLRPVVDPGPDQLRPGPAGQPGPAGEGGPPGRPGLVA